ncbi:hypothetical protein [Novipirellula sp.]|uniref:hypothetical protein n=1 Tax=Novipirellula sp. TaxID=2795430 RepID=UPI00356139F1
MLWLIGILLVTIVLTAWWFNSASTPSADQWTPISEDEFIRRCSPGVNRERALKVRRIIAEQLGVDYDRIYPEQRFVEDLGCD